MRGLSSTWRRQRAALCRLAYLVSLCTASGCRPAHEAQAPHIDSVSESGSSAVSTDYGSDAGSLVRPGRYTVTDIGPPGSACTADAINNLGQIVGVETTTGADSVFVWRSGSLISLGGFANYKGLKVCGLNDAGDVVGSASNGYKLPDSPPTAVRVHNRQMQAIFPDLRCSESAAINNAGQVCVNICTVLGRRQAFVWRGGGTAVGLKSLTGGDTAATGINSLGDVVGYSAASNGEAHAVLWSAGGLQDLGTLGGWSSTAMGINAGGLVVGMAEDGHRQSRACIWKAGHPIDLGSQGNDACLLRVNRAGAAVGYRDSNNTGMGSTRALLLVDRKLWDLNDLIPTHTGWVLENARDINDHGWIVGDGQLNGIERGFLLKPVTAPDRSHSGPRGHGKPVPTRRSATGYRRTSSSGMLSGAQATQGWVGKFACLRWS